VLQLGRVPGAPWVTTTGSRQAHLDGFDLHANVAVAANNRDGLEQLARYVLRPPIAQERLSRTADGRVLLTLKTEWSDGTTHLVFEPVELLERLAALTPRPRINLVLYHGVLAPHSRWRARVVAYGREALGSVGSDAAVRCGTAAPPVPSGALPPDGGLEPSGATHRDPGDPLTTTAYQLKDAESTPDGIDQLVLKVGDAGSARFTLKGKGALLPLPGEPPRPPVLPMPSPLSLRLQLRADTGTCWESTVSQIGVLRNDVEQLKAHTD
jgi:hypothetical protein